MSTISVIGAGAWGTALAQSLSEAGGEILLWARDPAFAEELRQARENKRYLPGIRLGASLGITSDLVQAANADILLLAVPAQHLREIAGRLATHVRRATPAVICAKGLEQATGKRLSAVLAESLPKAKPAVLSGPGFASDVAKGLPTAVTLVAGDLTDAESLSNVLGHRSLRLYWTDDLVGVELGGALKNVLAIAAGIVVGRKLGPSAHAAIVTRGFAEMTRLAVACGARPETLAGLSGLGDLILTCGSPQSRNMSLGQRLGEGETLATILGARRSVSEGVWTASAAVALAKTKGIEVPVMAAVADVLAGRIGIDEAMMRLLARPQRAEG